MRKSAIPFFISSNIEGRPVRWATTIGDYSGHDRTLEVFNANAKDQRRLLDQILKITQQFEKEIGGTLIVIFHSIKQTTKMYNDFATSFQRSKSVQ